MITINQTVPVGKTELHLRPFGLGAAPLSGVGQAVAVEIVQYAFEHGAKFIDTAPGYGRGLSERYLGAALAGVPRDDYVLATKVGRLISDDQTIFDYSRDGVLRSLEESLARLKIDYVDILHIHDPDRHYEVALNEAFPALADLRSQGVIKAVGAGMNQWQMLAQFARDADFDCFLLAGRYTLLEQTSLDLLSLCREKKISLILGGVYNSGILASDLQAGARYNYRPAPAEILARAGRLAAVCERYEVPLNAAAIQFPLAHPAVAAIAVGAQAKAEVAANIAALQMPIPSELWADLQREGLLEAGIPVPA